MLNGLVAYSYTDFNTRSDARKDFFIKLQVNSCGRLLCVVSYTTMKIGVLIMTGKAFIFCFYFLIFVFLGEGEPDENSTSSHFSIRRNRVMSIVEENGNKPVYTDFFIRILIIRIESPKTRKIKNFLRIMLRLTYHNFGFLLSNVILGKIDVTYSCFIIPYCLLPH